MTDIEVTGLGKRFGAVDALSDVSFSLSGRKICGLLGRNGAGKTTLLSILAGYERQTRGTVRVDGVPVFENAAAAAATCLVRGTGDASSPSVKVRDLVELAGRLRHGWDAGTRVSCSTASRCRGTARPRSSRTASGARSA
jgi:ABC-2 type transport system ATP-binding protein